MQGRNADSLAQYFGEDPARCPFEQGMQDHVCPFSVISGRQTSESYPLEFLLGVGPQ